MRIQLTLGLVAALLTPLSSSAAEKVIAVFNAGGVGVKKPDIHLVNNKPCGTNGKDPVYFCMRSMHATSLATRNDFQALIQGLPAHLKKWSADKKNSNTRWTNVFFSNLAAVVWEENLDKPEVRLEHGMGRPIPKNEVALYLRVPERFSMANLEKWLAEQGKTGWVEQLLAKYLVVNPNQLLNPRCESELEKERFKALFGKGLIRIDTVRADQPRYSSIAREQAKLQEALTPAKKTDPMKEIYEFCLNENEEYEAGGGLDARKDGKKEKLVLQKECAIEKKELGGPAQACATLEGLKSERQLMSLAECLRANGYSGEVETVAGIQSCKGKMRSGKRQGLWICRAEELKEREERIYQDGQKTSSRIFAVDPEGREFLEKESFEADGIVMREVRYRPDGKREQEFHRTPDMRFERETRFCADGTSIREFSEFNDKSESDWKVIHEAACPEDIN